MKGSVIAKKKKERKTRQWRNSIRCTKLSTTWLMAEVLFTCFIGLSLIARTVIVVVCCYVKDEGPFRVHS